MKQLQLNRINISTVIVLCCALSLPSLTFAQNALEEITVTGSYIKRPADQPQPITVLDAVDLEYQNRGSIAEVFKDLPQVQGTVATINWSEGGNSPTNTINLRGLGARATLVLLNSKRQTIDGSNNGQGVSAVDVNNLAPSIMIERVEILTDGASALYGSDAVAGVVNFITRNDFQGMEVRANGIWSEDSPTSTPEFNLQGLFGSQGDKTSIVAGFEYASTEQIQSNDRYSDDRLREGFVSAFGNPGNFQPANVTPGGPVPAGGPRPDPLCGSAEIGGGLQAGIQTVGPLCRAVLPFGRSLIPDMQRFNGLAVIDHNFDTGINLNMEIGFARKRVSNTFGHGLPIVAQPRPFVPATNPGVIEANAQDPTFALRDYFVWFREKSSAFDEPAPQFFEQDTYRLAGSLDGEIGDTGWDWLFSGTYSVNDSRFVDVEAIRARLDAALIGFGGRNCNASTGTAGVGDCQYWNPFANRITAQPGDAHYNDPDILDWFSAGRVVEGQAELITGELMATGQLWEMAGGTTGIAVGGQYRHQTFSQDFDDITEGGGFAFNNQAFADYAGLRTTWAFFAELVAFPTDWAEIQLAARYEDSEGKNSVEPKVGLLLTPRDDLYIRATWGTSFRVPGEVQSFGKGPAGGSAAFVGGDQINARGQTTGSSLLSPESSESWTAGITWDATDNLTLNLDYWMVEFTDLIVPESAQQILDADMLDGFITDPRIILAPQAPTNEVCEVTRANEVPLPTAQTDPMNCLSGFDFLLYDLSYINQDQQKTSGLDFGVSFDHEGWGADWALNVTGSYILEYETVEGGVAFDGVGSRNSRNLGVPMPEWKGSITGSWRRNNHYARVTGRYIDGLDNDNKQQNPLTSEASFTTFDFLYEWIPPVFDGATTLTFSISNFLDREDPFADNALSTSTSSVYDVRGRRFGLALKHNF